MSTRDLEPRCNASSFLKEAQDRALPPENKTLIETRGVRTVKRMVTEETPVRCNSVRDS